MDITLNITEDSKVELIKDSCEAVQGENNVVVLNIDWPSTIKGYSINNYAKQIEFGECKELGECVKFLDRVEGNVYKLCDKCTAFKKIMIQFTLKNLVDEAEPIVWKSVPFALEFCESINAENQKEIQTQLLSLAEIEKEWENYIKAHTLRMIYRVGDVPTADATSLGDTIFYLGANSTDPYTLTYGHYYRCNYANDAYEWTDLTQDPSLEGVANGIREISKNQTMQFWVDTKEKLKDEVIQPNTIYIPEDHDIKETFDEILTEMAADEKYKLAYPLAYASDIAGKKRIRFSRPSSDGTGYLGDYPITRSDLQTTNYYDKWLPLNCIDEYILLKEGITPSKYNAEKLRIKVGGAFMKEITYTISGEQEEFLGVTSTYSCGLCLAFLKLRVSNNNLYVKYVIRKPSDLSAISSAEAYGDSTTTTIVVGSFYYLAD